MGHLETIEGTGRLFEKDKFVVKGAAPPRPMTRSLISASNLHCSEIAKTK